MAISLNYTSFTMKGLEIRQAMAHVLKTGEAVRMLNRNKQPFLLVTIAKDALGYCFRFLDTDGRDVGHMVLKAAVRNWADLDSLHFWSLNAESYDLTEHPLVTLAREEQARNLKAERIAILKAQGVSHEARTYGGKRLHVGFQRDWLGRKRMYAVQPDGTFKKVSREVFLMISWTEPL